MLNKKQQGYLDDKIKMFAKQIVVNKAKCPKNQGPTVHVTDVLLFLHKSLRKE